jgi:hypothetical protein
MGNFCEVSTKEGLTMTYREWINYLDTLNLNEIQNIYWSQFDKKGRDTLNNYFKIRLLNQK